ncbi:MAG: cbb3-type cytochrome c oxidase subunit I [Methyloligellaceae bacterium]
MATATALSPTELDALVDKALVRKWLLTGMFWLMFTPTIGAVISTYFNFPDYLGTALEVQFGRLRPMHVNGVIFGAFSTLFIGLCYYVVPRLCGIRVVWEQAAHLLVWIWNLALAAGMVALALGHNQGLEAGEFPFYVDLVIFLAISFLTVQFLVTTSRRTEPQLYVSMWYLLAAFVWTVMNMVLGTFILPYFISGISSAAFHGLFIHYIVGLWITPAGYVVIYYFLPASVKNPIYSHKLSLIGFWSLALFYPFVGIHHYLFSPIADWAETLSIITSMLLIVPVWTVLQNFFGTMIGRWQDFGRNLTAKFLIMGSLMYLIGCFQGSTEALRSIQEPTHFTDFVISHSHLTVFGTFVVWAVGGLVYVWPKIHGRELWSFKAGNWAFWMITCGITTMGIVLTAQGLQQGYMWMAGVEWMDSMVAIKAFWYVRTLAGITMDLGMTLLVFNLLRTAMASEQAAETPGAAAPAPA